jgi:hypothetical protein
MLGERSGPVDTEWHRATVIVSRDRLLSQREMDYWTFAARRLEDPNGAGVIDFDGVGSLKVASGNRFDLRNRHPTAVRAGLERDIRRGLSRARPARLARCDFRQ